MSGFHLKRYEIKRIYNLDKFSSIFLYIKMDRFIYNKNQMSINQSITKTTYMYRLIFGTTFDFDLLHYTYIVSIIFACFLFFFCYKRGIRGRVLCVCVWVGVGWGWLLMIGRKVQILIFSLSYLRMC